MKFIGIFENYPIYLSTRKNKKYMARVNDRWIHFGDKRYEHYHDKMAYYKNLDHLDKRRRLLYHLRHKHDYPMGSADWFSKMVLWS